MIVKVSSDQQQESIKEESHVPAKQAPCKKIKKAFKTPCLPAKNVTLKPTTTYTATLTPRNMLQDRTSTKPKTSRIELGK
jgi:hypothetical protein